MRTAPGLSGWGLTSIGNPDNRSATFAARQICLMTSEKFAASQSDPIGKVSPGPLRPGGFKLRRHLALILLLKVVVLVILWNLFIGPYRVAVDHKVMMQRLSGPATPASRHINGDNRHD
jgi:hypothetical protein